MNDFEDKIRRTQSLNSISHMYRERLLPLHNNNIFSDGPKLLSVSSSLIQKYLMSYQYLGSSNGLKQSRYRLGQSLFIQVEVTNC